MSKKLKHGDKIDIKKQYVSYKYQGNKTWKQRDIKEEKNCLFLGYRTVKEGKIEYDPEEGYYFYPNNHITVMLVSVNSKLNPIYVPIKENE